MENIQKNKAPGYLIPVAIIASLACMVFEPLCLLVPALLASVMIRYKKAPYGTFLLMAAPLIVASIMLSDSESLIPSVSLAALCVLPAVAIWYGQANNKGGFVTAFYTAGVCIVCIYCMVCLKGILNGTGAFADVITATKESAQQLTSMIESVELPEQYPINKDELIAQMALIRELIPSFTMPIICILGCIVGLSNTLFFYLFTSKVRKELKLTKLSPFRTWTVPRFYTGGMVILVICTFITYLVNSDAAATVSSTVSALFGFPFAVQALSLIDFLIVKKGTNIKGKRIIIFFLCAFGLVLFSSAFVMVGCFEQIFQSRKRLSKNGSGRNKGTML